MLTRRSLRPAAVFLLLGVAPLAPAPAAGGTGSWTPSGPQGTYAAVVAADAETGQVYASSYSSEIFRSDDRGMTWTPASGATWTLLPLTLSAPLVVHDPRTPGIVYAASGFNAGLRPSLWQSVDGGTTFQPGDLPIPIAPEGIADLGIDPQDSRDLIAAGWFHLSQAVPFHFQAFRSTDGGSSWTSFADTLVNPQALGKFTGVRFDPLHPQNVYLLGDQGFRSTDGGVTWSPFNPYQVLTGVPYGGLADLAIDPFQPQVLYALTPGLLKSTDGGQSWQRLSGPPGVVQRILPDPHRPDTLYAIGPDLGVWVSTDGAAHWTSIGAGLPDAPVVALAFDPFQPGHLFAATAGHEGLYTYTTP